MVATAQTATNNDQLNKNNNDICDGYHPSRQYDIAQQRREEQRLHQNVDKEEDDGADDQEDEK